MSSRITEGTSRLRVRNAYTFCSKVAGGWHTGAATVSAAASFCWSQPANISGLLMRCEISKPSFAGRLRLQILQGLLQRDLPAAPVHDTISWDEPASKFIMAKHRLGHARFRARLANSPPVWQKGDMRYHSVTCPVFFPKIDHRVQRGVEFVNTVNHIHTWQSFLEPLQSTAIAGHMMSKKKTENIHD